MKPVVIFLAASLAILTWPSFCYSEQSDELCVMTFNLRFASPGPPPDGWVHRRPIVQAVIRQVSPDVLGTQEGIYQQLKDLHSDLPEYEWIGLGRDGGSRGEFMAVFYRSERLEPLEFDHFWLSDTPNVIASSTWGNTNRRMVTWVRFFNRQTKHQFYYVNTHFDHQVQKAREKSAQLVLDRVKKLRGDLPVLLAGDFNATAGANKAYDILVNKDAFVDTWAASQKRGEPYGTFGAYRPPKKGGPRIDWILARGSVTTVWTEVVTFSKNGQYPSDHFPVVARVRLGTMESSAPGLRAE
jgi:endonuclease/exonuclease/phosphatase family metal-dependent hydrolase